MKSGVVSMIRFFWTIASWFHSALYLLHNPSLTELLHSSEKHKLKWIWNARSLPGSKDQGGESRTEGKIVSSNEYLQTVEIKEERKEKWAGRESF